VATYAVFRETANPMRFHAFEAYCSPSALSLHASNDHVQKLTSRLSSLIDVERMSVLNCTVADVPRLSFTSATDTLPFSGTFWKPFAGALAPVTLAPKAVIIHIALEAVGPLVAQVSQTMRQMAAHAASDAVNTITSLWYFQETNDPNRFHILEVYQHPYILMEHLTSPFVREALHKLTELTVFVDVAVLNTTMAECPIMQQLGASETQLFAGFLSRAKPLPLSPRPVVVHAVMMAKTGSEEKVTQCLNELTIVADSDKSVATYAVFRETVNTLRFHSYAVFPSPAAAELHSGRDQVKRLQDTLLTLVDDTDVTRLNASREECTSIPADSEAFPLAGFYSKCGPITD